MASSTYTSEAAGSGTTFLNSDKAELTYFGDSDTKSFQLIVVDKHFGYGVFAAGESEALLKPPTVPSPDPLPAKGTFNYNSWDDVLQTSALQFSSGPDKDGLSIVFYNGGTEVAKYSGGSGGTEGGSGYFKWSK